jgi:hypothetical protein
MDRGFQVFIVYDPASIKPLQLGVRRTPTLNARETAFFQRGGQLKGPQGFVRSILCKVAQPELQLGQ